jgi:hypothetical protein
MTDKYGIVAIRVQGAIRLVGDGDAREARATIKDEWRRGGEEEL